MKLITIPFALLFKASHAIQIRAILVEIHSPTLEQTTLLTPRHRQLLTSWRELNSYTLLPCNMVLEGLRRVSLNTPDERCTCQGGGQGQPPKSHRFGHPPWPDPGLIPRTCPPGVQPGFPLGLKPGQRPGFSAGLQPSCPPRLHLATLDLTPSHPPPSLVHRLPFEFFFGFALFMVVAMMRGALVWLSTTWRRPCMFTRSWV